MCVFTYTFIHTQVYIILFQEGDNSLKKKYSKHITSVVTSSDYTIFNLKCDYRWVSEDRVIIQ